MSGKVYIVGIGSTEIGRHPDKSVKDLTRRAVDLALKDANATLADIEAAWFSNTRQGMMENQNTIRGQCALRSMGFETIPIVNVENACASSSTGLNQAFAQIKAGLCEVALVVGAEKMFYPDKKELMFQAFLGGWDVHDMDAARTVLLGLGDGLDVAAGGAHEIPGNTACSWISMHRWRASTCACMVRPHGRSRRRHPRAISTPR